mgnify:CR=1 FL=1
MDAAETRTMAGMDKLKNIIKAASTVLSVKKYSLIFVLLFVVVFWIIILVPGWIISADIRSQGFSVSNFTFLAAVSVLTSLVITLQLFSFKITGKAGAAQSAFSGAGFFSALSAAIFSSATCGLCIATVFSFLGVGSVIFLVDNRAYVIAGSVVLLLLSLYFSSKKVNNDCEVCHV